MNSCLWILQVVLAAAFLWVGVGHAFYPEMVRRVIGWAKWIAEARREFLTFIGVCEILGALGLILPASTGILPWLTPLAALGLATMMILAGGFHILRREYPAIIPNVVLFVVAALVAYGRWVTVPL
jgi:uncharacterized membrane protein